MPDPMAEVLAAMYERLEDDATLDDLAPGGVWTGNAPLSVTSYPYVTLSLASGNEAYTFTQPYTHGHLIFVRAVNKGGDQGPAIDALSRCYDLLQDADLDVQGFDLQYIRRAARGPTTSPVEQGTQFQNLVDQYRIEVGP